MDSARSLYLKYLTPFHSCRLDSRMEAYQVTAGGGGGREGGWGDVREWGGTRSASACGTAQQESACGTAQQQSACGTAQQESARRRSSLMMPATSETMPGPQESAAKAKGR